MFDVFLKRGSCLRTNTAPQPGRSTRRWRSNALLEPLHGVTLRVVLIYVLAFQALVWDLLRGHYMVPLALLFRA